MAMHQREEKFSKLIFCKTSEKEEENIVFKLKFYNVKVLFYFVKYLATSSLTRYRLIIFQTELNSYPSNKVKYFVVRKGFM